MSSPAPRVNPRTRLASIQAEPLYWAFGIVGFIVFMLLCIMYFADAGVVDMDTRLVAVYELARSQFSQAFGNNSLAFDDPWLYAGVRVPF
jgi:hypothetical protein